MKARKLDIFRNLGFTSYELRVSHIQRESPEVPKPKSCADIIRGSRIFPYCGLYLYFILFVIFLTDAELGSAALAL